MTGWNKLDLSQKVRNYKINFRSFSYAKVESVKYHVRPAFTLFFIVGPMLLLTIKITIGIFVLIIKIELTRHMA